MTSQDINYEVLPADKQMDETDINLRSYFSRVLDEKLSQYRPDWTDQELMTWDDNFTSEGNLFLICSEREVLVDEFRAVLEEHLKLRGLA